MNLEFDNGSNEIFSRLTRAIVLVSAEKRRSEEKKCPQSIIEYGHRLWMRDYGLRNGCVHRECFDNIT